MMSPRVAPTVNVRELVPFAGATLLAFMLVPIGWQVNWPEYVLALALTLAVFAGIALTPWQRVPAGARLVPPVVFLAAVALLRDSGGGFTSGTATLALLPVFWVALHGTRAGLGLVVLGVAAFLAVPVLTVDEPAYPTSALKTGVLFVVVVRPRGRHRSAPRRRRSLRRRATASCASASSRPRRSNAMRCSLGSSGWPRPIP